MSELNQSVRRSQIPGWSTSGGAVRLRSTATCSSRTSQASWRDWTSSPVSQPTCGRFNTAPSIAHLARFISLDSFRWVHFAGFDPTCRHHAFIGSAPSFANSCASAIRPAATRAQAVDALYSHAANRTACCSSHAKSRRMAGPWRHRSRTEIQPARPDQHGQRRQAGARLVVRIRLESRTGGDADRRRRRACTCRLPGRASMR